eukprot:211285_1
MNDDDDATAEIEEMKVCKHYQQKPCVYEWEIEQENDIRKIQEASNGFNFVSEIFVMFGLKWYLEFIPVPSDRDPEDIPRRNIEMIIRFCICAVQQYHPQLKKFELIIRWDCEKPILFMQIAAH